MHKRKHQTSLRPDDEPTAETLSDTPGSPLLLRCVRCGLLEARKGAAFGGLQAALDGSNTPPRPRHVLGH